MAEEKKKKIPERRCVGCGESFPKKDLIRVVRDPSGNVSLDFTGKKAGRGAYLCKKQSCFKKARKAGRFNSNLNCTVPDEVLDELYEALAAELQDGGQK